MRRETVKLLRSIKPAPLGSAVVAWNSTLMLAAVSFSNSNATSSPVSLSILGAFTLASGAAAAAYIVANKLSKPAEPTDPS